MTAERVVVEVQLAVLDEEAVAQAVASARIDNAMQRLGADGDLDGERPLTPTQSGRGVRGDVRDRPQVLVRAAGVRRAGSGGATEQLDGAVVEWQHTHLAGLAPPQVDHLAQLLGLLGSEVVALREVLVEVEQLPLVVVVGVAHLVIGGRLPAVGPDPPVTHLLEVLHRAWRGRRGVVERRGDAPAVHRDLLVATDVLGGRCPRDVEHRRRDVDGMTELVTDFAACGHARRPVHHQWVAYAAAVRVLLVPPQRTVAGLRPAPRVVAVRVLSADVVEAVIDDLVDVLPHCIEEAELVHHSERPAFAAGAVVAHHHQQRVVELIVLLEELDEATDLVVGVLQHGGECLLQAAGEPLLLLGQLIPRRHARVARCLGGAGRHDAQLQLVLVPALAQHVVALVELATPALQVVVGCLVGRVHGAEREVEEERPIRSHGHEVADPTRALVDEVFADVIADVATGGRAVWRVDVVVVVGELGVELIGLTLEETVEAVEALLQRPVVMRAGGGCFLHRREVPLAGGIRGVAVAAQQFGDGGCPRGDAAAHVRVAGVPIRDATHADRVVVAARQQASPRGGAQRRGVEAGVAQAAGGEAVDVRGLQRAAVAVEVRETGVVEDDHHHVGAAESARRFRPPRLRLLVGTTDAALEPRFAHHLPFTCATI